MDNPSPTDSLYIVEISGRSAIPVRSIPFITNSEIDPVTVVRWLAGTEGFYRLPWIESFYVIGGTPALVPAEEWSNLIVKLDGVNDGRALEVLPPYLVWRDDFEAAWDCTFGTQGHHFGPVEVLENGDVFIQTTIGKPAIRVILPGENMLEQAYGPFRTIKSSDLDEADKDGYQVIQPVSRALNYAAYLPESLRVLLLEGVPDNLHAFTEGSKIIAKKIQTGKAKISKKDRLAHAIDAGIIAYQERHKLHPTNRELWDWLAKNDKTEIIFEYNDEKDVITWLRADGGMSDTTYKAFQNRKPCAIKKN